VTIGCETLPIFKKEIAMVILNRFKKSNEIKVTNKPYFIKTHKYDNALIALVCLGSFVMSALIAWIVIHVVYPL